MALFSFGKKDKNPTEGAGTVAKAPPTPPKIQTPPSPGNLQAVKPPQPSGLIPAPAVPSGAATTQPMIMPRGGGGLKPARAGVAQGVRSTQRIVLPSASGNVRPNTGALLNPTATGRINLPMGMILRCLPPEVLAADISEFEASGAAATEIGLPMNTVLSQLPSGKVEIALQDLVPHFPPGYLQPVSSLGPYLPTLINLPLMDVVMRIPPDLLALRPDQKDVDASVINMADPFTEEILREQAEAARRATQANIRDESQVPAAEEFVPQVPAPKTIAPPPRPPSVTLPQVGARAAEQAPAFPSVRPPTTALPLPVARSLTPAPTAPRPINTLTPPPPLQVQPPATPFSTTSESRSIPGDRPPIPGRATTPLPTRPSTGLVSPDDTARGNFATTPLPSGARQTGSLPVPPQPPQILAPTRNSVFSTPPVSKLLPREEPLRAPNAITAPLPPDRGADELQKLAALAMAELGDTAEPSGKTSETSGPEEVSALVPQETAPLAVPEPEPSEPQRPTEPEPEIISAEAETPVEEPEPVQEPEPEPAAQVQPEPERFRPILESRALPTVPSLRSGSVTAPIPLVDLQERAAKRSLKTSTQEMKPLVPAANEPVQETKAPVPAVKAPTQEMKAPAPQAVKAPESTPSEAPSNVAVNLNNCAAEDLLSIPGCTRELAQSIVRHRNKIGSFRKLEDLLDVPGMTRAAYCSLTGENPPSGSVPQSLNELLGFPADQSVSLKEVTDRIACWPDVTGCVLSQSTGLSLVGSVPDFLDKTAVVAFAPRMFEAINKSFAEITGRETDELIIPTTGTSFHILRNKDLYLIILSRLPQMPERHLKIARFVLAGLSVPQAEGR